MKIMRPIIILALILSVAAGQRQKKIRDNIEQFRMSAIAFAVGDDEAIKTAIYFEIPNFTLQFIKQDSGFVADFEVVCSVRDKEGQQYGRFIWERQVTVNDYRESTSRTLFTTLHTIMDLPARELVLIGELMDKDTRNRGQNEKEIDLSEFGSGNFIFPLVLLRNQPGNWGIVDDFVPVFNNKIPLDDNGYHLFLAGRLAREEYDLSILAYDNADELTWEQQYSFVATDNRVSHIIDIPGNVLEGINARILARINQGDQVYDQVIKISIVNPGISESINNIDDAISQLRYIATSEELEAFDDAGREEQEQLFREFWEKRDETPNTVRNELMDEYYFRVRYANEHFSTFIPGWRTDMGMIFIIFGPPDDIERSYSSASRYTGQEWFYYSINRSFIFIDQSGFGDYRLATPYYGQGTW